MKEVTFWLKTLDGLGVSSLVLQQCRPAKWGTLLLLRLRACALRNTPQKCIFGRRTTFWFPLAEITTFTPQMTIHPQIIIICAVSLGSPQI